MFATDTRRTTHGDSDADWAPFDRDIPHVPEPSLGLTRLAPGPELAAVVASLDPDSLGDDQLVEYLQATDRLVSHAQAVRADAIVAVVERCTDPEFAHLEIGTALHWTRRAAETAVAFAWDLCRRVPRVRGLLSSGQVDWARARVLTDTTSHLDETTARKVIDQIAGDAPDLTSGQLRSRLTRLVIDLDPHAADTRYEESVADRRVVAHPSPDGTGTLVATHLPADRIAAAMGHLDHLARTHRRDGDPRTSDQLRADLLLDLLTGACAHHPTRRAIASITIDLDTARGTAHRAGDIPGWGPVPPRVAQRILTEDPTAFEWRLIGIGSADPAPTESRQPTAAQRRHIETRHPTCIFPGCRAPSTATDLDHTQPVATDGKTDVHNLAPLCRHHHRAKHQAGWAYRITTDGVTWTSPLGRTYPIRGPSP